MEDPWVAVGKNGAVADVDVTDLVVHMAGVSVRRGKNTLVGNIDWSVELDERWVVLGPNGAGKTTLLRIAAGLARPSRGQLLFEGSSQGAAARIR